MSNISLKNDEQFAVLTRKQKRLIEIQKQKKKRKKE